MAHLSLVHSQLHRAVEPVLFRCIDWMFRNWSEEEEEVSCTHVSCPHWGASSLKYLSPLKIVEQQILDNFNTQSPRPYLV